MWKGLSSLNKVHLHEAELFLYIKAKGGVKEGRRGRRTEQRRHKDFFVD